LPLSPYHRAQFYLGRNQLAEIKRRSAETGVPQSEIVRRIITKAFAEN